MNPTSCSSKSAITSEAKHKAVYRDLVNNWSRKNRHAYLSKLQRLFWAWNSNERTSSTRSLLLCLVGRLRLVEVKTTPLILADSETSLAPSMASTYNPKLIDDIKDDGAVGAALACKVFT